MLVHFCLSLLQNAREEALLHGNNIKRTQKSIRSKRRELVSKGAYDEDCKIEVFDFTSWVPAVETA